MTTQTLDGKCMQCAPSKSANGSKCCRMCGESKPDSEFRMWKIQHSARSNKSQACDKCLLQEEVKRKDEEEEEKDDDGDVAAMTM